MRRIIAVLTVTTLVLMMIGLQPLSLAAGTNMTVIDFEEFRAVSLGGLGGDQEILNSYFDQYGISFTGATSLSTADESLSPYYPAYSGDAVVFDYPGNGTITILFKNPVTEVGGYFTSAKALTFTAYDVYDNQVGQDLSLNKANYKDAGTGMLPNAYLHVAFDGGISKVIIRDSGNTYTLDDLTFGPHIPYRGVIGGEVGAIDKLGLISPWFIPAGAAVIGGLILLLSRRKNSRIN
jgi:hypothetical protein